MAPFPSATSTWHSTTYASISPTRLELSAKGKTVLITGGGTGIGAGTARSFAEAGASRIALLGRRIGPLLATKADIESRFPGVEIFISSTDVTKKDQVDAAFEMFVGNAKVDVVVSNAGQMGPPESVEDADDKFLSAIQQSIQGSLLVAQAFLRHAAADAVAINVSSSAAHLNFAAGFASYSIAKAAIIRLWDSLAFAHPKLSIFHTQPGVVDTDMNKVVGGVAAIGLEDNVSLPSDFAVWLASSEAQFLKGKFIWSNWDVEELKAMSGAIDGSLQLNIGLIGWPFEKSS